MVANEKYLQILHDSAEIEEFLEYILTHNNVAFTKSSFQSKINAFCEYIDAREITSRKSTEKIYNNKYSLKDVLSAIKADRDIAVHQANSLIDGLSKLPKKSRTSNSKFSKQYIGDIDALHLHFTKYSEILYPLYKVAQTIGAGAFEVFDIDNTRIGEG